MGHGLKLTDEQWDELNQMWFSTSSSDVFRNCLIILMSHSRDSGTCICERMGCSRDTVLRVRRAVSPWCMIGLNSDTDAIIGLRDDADYHTILADMGYHGNKFASVA